MKIFKEFHFEAAHFLPNVPPGHKCRNMHGHSYRLILYLEGPVKNPSGWVMDFGEIKKVTAPLIEKLDHHLLNEIEGLENPTVENIAKWIWSNLESKLPLLSEIHLYETQASGCIFSGRISQQLT